MAEGNGEDRRDEGNGGGAGGGLTIFVEMSPQGMRIGYPKSNPGAALLMVEALRRQILEDTFGGHTKEEESRIHRVPRGFQM